MYCVLRVPTGEILAPTAPHPFLPCNQSVASSLGQLNADEGGLGILLRVVSIWARVYRFSVASGARVRQGQEPCCQVSTGVLLISMHMSAFVLRWKG